MVDVWLTGGILMMVWGKLPARTMAEWKRAKGVTQRCGHFAEGEQEMVSGFSGDENSSLNTLAKTGIGNPHFCCCDIVSITHVISCNLVHSVFNYSAP